ncbi:MAG: hypothetical protein ACLFVW_00990 [Phycisphaerae bacterium]
MNPGQFNPNRQAEPAEDTDEQLLDDLADGHVGELARRRPCQDTPMQPETPAEGEQQTAEPSEGPYESPDEPHARAPGSSVGKVAEGSPPDDGQQSEDRGGEEDGAVDELLSAVERITGRQPARPRRKDPLLGSVRSRPRLRLRLSAKARAVLAQSAALAAGTAGTALLAWLMFG